MRGLVAIRKRTIVLAPEKAIVRMLYRRASTNQLLIRYEKQYHEVIYVAGGYYEIRPEKETRS